MAKITHAHCSEHSYGSHIVGSFGLQWCIECLKEKGEQPIDYHVCSKCGFDHTYEPFESMCAAPNLFDISALV
jgi:hypothetical protein